MAQNSILIFVKVPTPGLVKTRLAENTCLSDSEVALLAEAMLKDTLLLASKSNSDIIEIGYFPEKEIETLKRIVNDISDEIFLNKKIIYHLQNGSNFDESFESVVLKSLSLGVKNLIILGADLPYLDPQVLNDSFNSLATYIGKKVIVLGPASEGGIYLVGINNEFNPKWFSKYQLFRGGIELSQFKTLCQTKKFAQILMPYYTDIDIETDLVSLILNIESLSISTDYRGFYFPYYTSEIIKNLGLYVKESKGKTRNRKIAKRD